MAEYDFSITLRLLRRVLVAAVVAFAACQGPRADADGIPRTVDLGSGNDEVEAKIRDNVLTYKQEVGAKGSRISSVPLPAPASGTFATEPLKRLMSGVAYGGDYNNMKHAEDVVATGWERYYDILVNHHCRFSDLGRSYQIEIRPIDSGTSPTMAVSVKGADEVKFEEIYREANPAISEVAGKDNHLSLQSHWVAAFRLATLG